jgi:hypothetical protein
MAFDLVGLPGLEPGTSSLSGCRRSGSDSGFGVVLGIRPQHAFELPCNVLRLHSRSLAF